MKALDATDEKDLLLRLRDGDEQAFNSLYHHYQPGLLLYAFKLTDNEDDAADLVQELFISLWNKRAQLTFNTSFRSYLYRAVRHRFLNLNEHHKARNEFHAGLAHYLTKLDHSTEHYIAETELFAHIDLLLAKMPTNMAQVFQLRNENLSEKEIAKRLNLSEKTVRNLMSEASKNIRNKLKYLTALFLLFL